MKLKEFSRIAGAVMLAISVYLPRMAGADSPSPVAATPAPAAGIFALVADTTAPEADTFAVAAFPLAPDAVLYDQTANAAAIEITSQDFVADRPDLSNQAADDFLIPGGGNSWSIDRVDVQGRYVNITDAHPVVVQFYTNSGANLPDVLVYTTTVTPAAGNADFQLTLSPAALLAPGTYWLSVYAVHACGFGQQCQQWFWDQRTVLANTASVWRNPGGGASGGTCLAWARRAATCGVGIHPDLVFSLNGTNAASHPVPVLQSLSPKFGPPNQPITVTVSGFPFVNGAVGTWNGSDRNTEFVDYDTVRIGLLATDLTAAGVTGQVRVYNPGPTSASNALTFTAAFQTYFAVIRR